MSPRLRPLRLPALVEQRRKYEECHAELENDLVHDFDMDLSSTDAISPVTPTFSPGHLRYSSSTSSFEVTTPANSEPPTSPTQGSHKQAKQTLPDVEEEPIEDRNSFDDLGLLYSNGSISEASLYECLCYEPCVHGTSMNRNSSDFYTHTGDAGFDFGFHSDGDLNMSARASRRPRADVEKPLTGFTQRIGSKFTGITQWRKRQASITQSPVSDFGFEQRPALSRAASSRSSSVSAAGQYSADRANEPPLPPTPALSYYNRSTESVVLPLPFDAEKVMSLDPAEIERDRALSTTPLLPPFMNENFPNTAQVSPLASPKVASSPVLESAKPMIMSPPLSARPSVASFHHKTVSGEMESLSEEEENWCNRLGHANYTIKPLPYKPDTVHLDTLHKLRADWAEARVQYTKHLARTGEHYGVTSKTYELTEAKWVETKALWRKYHDEAASFIIASGAADSLPKFDEDVLTAVPHMDTEGKFPERGDEDIVGPMVREAAMVIPNDSPDRRSASFWRNLAGRVGLRK